MKEPRTLSEISDDAVHILMRELGAADTIRFLNQYRRGHGDYTRDRHALFEGMTVEEIFAASEEAAASFKFKGES